MPKRPNLELPASVAPPPATNAPEMSVSELANALKRTVEDRFPFVRVRGEISNYRGPHSSGHVYFSLKDQSARLDAVIWKGVFARLKTKPEDGLEVVATGKVTTFPGKSTYQIVIEALEPAGVGALMALLDARRKKLAAEGLFDEQRKKPLPFLPRVVGVVTSPTGAVIRDILHRLSDRFPRRVLVWPVRVQGETCAEEVAAAIAGFNALAARRADPAPRRVDYRARRRFARGFMGLQRGGRGARGGGERHSADRRDRPRDRHDAHRFRRRSARPDADRRRREMRARARRIDRADGDAGAPALWRGAAADGTAAHARFRPSSGCCRRREQVLAEPRQRSDRASERLRAALRAGLDARRLRLARAAQVLARHSPQAELARAGEKLKGLGARLRQGLVARASLARQQNAGAAQRVENAAARLERGLVALVSQQRSRLDQLEKLRQTLGHKAVLARGFALVRDEAGALLRRATDVAAGQRLDIEFADGRVLARADGGSEAPEPTPVTERKPRGKEKKSSGQGSLF